MPTMRTPDKPTAEAPGVTDGTATGGWAVLFCSVLSSVLSLSGFAIEAILALSGELLGFLLFISGRDCVRLAYILI